MSNEQVAVVCDWPDLDWRSLWKRRDELRKKPDDAEMWNSRANELADGKRERNDTYARNFIEYLALEPSQSVLDVGCGWGTLALPLAQAGHQVIALDFAPSMLEVVETRIKQDGVKGISTKLLSWEDDWPAAGLGEKSVDVAIASRSTMVKDLWGALEKLDRTARKKVAITMATEYAPRAFKKLGEPTDEQGFFVPDYIYGVNMLLRMSAYPELRFIDSMKPDADGTSRFIRWAWIAWKPVL